MTEERQIKIQYAYYQARSHAYRECRRQRFYLRHAGKFGREYWGTFRWWTLRRKWLREAIRFRILYYRYVHGVEPTEPWAWDRLDAHEQLIVAATTVILGAGLLLIMIGQAIGLRVE